MNTKKIAVILIAIAFTLIAIFSFIGLFSVKKVNVDFSVSANTDTGEVQRVLDTALGANLLFYNTEDLKSVLKDYHYLEVLSVDKQFPNQINVSIKERREVYYIINGSTVYVLTADGFVLNSFDASAFDGDVLRDKIMLSFDGIGVENIELGKTSKTDNDQAISAVFEIAKQVNLTDCIKSIAVEKVDGFSDVFDAKFTTYSGVSIFVQDVLYSKSSLQFINAFNAYDKLNSDFMKCSGQILAYFTDEDNDGVYDGYKVIHNYDQKDVVLFQENLA